MFCTDISLVILGRTCFTWITVAFEPLITPQMRVLRQRAQCAVLLQLVRYAIKRHIWQFATRQRRKSGIHTFVVTRICVGERNFPKSLDLHFEFRLEFSYFIFVFESVIVVLRLYRFERCIKPFFGHLFSVVFPFKIIDSFLVPKEKCFIFKTVYILLSFQQ